MLVDKITCIEYFLDDLHLSQPEANLKSGIRSYSAALRGKPVAMHYPYPIRCLVRPLLDDIHAEPNT